MHLVPDGQCAGLVPVAQPVRGGDPVDLQNTSTARGAQAEASPASRRSRSRDGSQTASRTTPFSTARAIDHIVSIAMPPSSREPIIGPTTSARGSLMRSFDRKGQPSTSARAAPTVLLPEPGIPLDDDRDLSHATILAEPVRRGRPSPTRRRSSRRSPGTRPSWRSTPRGREALVVARGQGRVDRVDRVPFQVSPSTKSNTLACSSSTESSSSRISAAKGDVLGREQARELMGHLHVVRAHLLEGAAQALRHDLLGEALAGELRDVLGPCRPCARATS